MTYSNTNPILNADPNHNTDPNSNYNPGFLVGKRRCKVATPIMQHSQKSTAHYTSRGR